MKKIITLIAVSVLGAATLLAQPGRGPFGNGRDYGRGHERHPHGHYNNLYGGIKAGLIFSHISSGTGDIDAIGVKTGTSLGLAAGFNISPMAAFESGLYYVEKGGIGRVSGGKVIYDLHYLELPLLLKVNVFSGRQAIFQPYAGAYLGMGVGGQIKDYRLETSASSFNDANFRRGDSGLAIGCGVTWSILHANLGYEYGLSDISKRGFGDNRNRALILSVGIAF